MAAPTRTFSDAHRRLREAQKSSKGVSLYSRFVNRPVGRILAAAAYRIGLGPNAVTILSAVVTGAGAVLLATVPPSALLGVSVAFLLVLGFALDSADGQVARLTGASSAAGEWLDHVIDAVKMVGVHAATLIGLYRFTDLTEGWLLVPVAYQIVATLLFAGGTLVSLLQRAAPAAVSASTPSLVKSVGLLPADYGVLAVAYVLWGATALFFPVYVALFVLTALITAQLVAKWFRILR